MSSEGTTDNRRTTNSTHTNTTNKNRDKRFLASLQSALGGESSRRHEIRPKNLETEEESTLTLSNALQKISLSNEGIADSVADVQPFLVQRANQFSEDEFNQLANVLFQSALEQTNIYFILEICSDLIAYPNFQSAFSDCLKDGVGKFLNGEKEQYENIPKIFAQLLSNKWQRKFNRATECSNFILFTVFNTVIGWINFVNTSCKDKEEIHSQKGDDENPQIFMRCIEGLLSFCNTGQRYLWMNYPELYDDIYNTVVELLVSNAILSRSVKASLLSLCQQMTKWSQANRPKYSNVATQTISRNY